MKIDTGTTLLLIGGGIIAANALTKSHNAGSLNFYPASVTAIRLDGATPVMTVGIAVQNTSNSKYVVRSIAANLYANNYLVGNLAYFIPQTVMPNSQSVFLLDVRLGLLGIVNDIIAAFQFGTLKQDLLLQGHVNVDNFQVELKIPYRVGG